MLPSVVIPSLGQNLSALQADINVKTAKSMAILQLMNSNKKRQAKLHLVDAQKVYQLQLFSQSLCAFKSFTGD